MTQATHVVDVTESLIVYQNTGQQETYSSMYSGFQPLLLSIWVHSVAIISVAAETG